MQNYIGLAAEGISYLCPYPYKQDYESLNYTSLHIITKDPWAPLLTYESVPYAKTSLSTQSYEKLVKRGKISKNLHLKFNKRPTGLNGHLSIRDFTLNSCQKGAYLHLSSIIIINKNQQLYRKQHHNAINVKYIDREEENTYSL